MSELLTDFLESLHDITLEELVKELEKAKEDSKNSSMIDERQQ